MADEIHEHGDVRVAQSAQRAGRHGLDAVEQLKHRGHQQQADAEFE